MDFFNIGSICFEKTKEIFISESCWENILLLFGQDNVRTLHLLPMAEINDDNHVNLTKLHSFKEFYQCQFTVDTFVNLEGNAKLECIK